MWTKRRKTRELPCQGRGRGFESLRPLHYHQRSRRPVARCVAPARDIAEIAKRQPAYLHNSRYRPEVAAAVNLAEPITGRAFPAGPAHPRYLALSEMTCYLLKAVESFVATL